MSDITTGGLKLYKQSRFLELRGWREECPLPRGRVFSHSAYKGRYGIDHALALEMEKTSCDEVLEAIRAVKSPCSCPPGQVGLP